MRPITILLPFLAFTAAEAQPTFTSAMLPQPGDSATMGMLPFQSFTNDFDAETGAGYNWDFTGIMTPVGGLLWPWAWRNPAEGLYASTYPTATVNEYAPIGGVDTYYEENASELLYLGNAASVAPEPWTWISFPLGFGNGGSEYTSYSNPNPPHQRISSKTHTWSYDGYGDLSFSWGSFQDLVRIKMVTIDSNFVLNSRMITTQYLWFQQGGGVPVLRISRLDEGPVPYPAGSYDVRCLYDAYNSIQGPTASRLALHPNPANTVVWLDLDGEPAEVTVFDTEGRAVLRTAMEADGKLDVSALAEGGYTVTAVTASGRYHVPLLVRH